MSVLHLTVADDNVFRRHGTFSSVAVSSALDGYAVVARVEKAILNEHSVA